MRPHRRRSRARTSARGRSAPCAGRRQRPEPATPTPLTAPSMMRTSKIDADPLEDAAARPGDEAGDGLVEVVGVAEHLGERPEPLERRVAVGPGMPRRYHEMAMPIPMNPTMTEIADSTRPSQKEGVSMTGTVRNTGSSHSVSHSMLRIGIERIPPMTAKVARISSGIVIVGGDSCGRWSPSTAVGAVRRTRRSARSARTRRRGVDVAGVRVRASATATSSEPPDTTGTAAGAAEPSRGSGRCRRRRGTPARVM